MLGFEKSSLGYSITYYLLLLKLPTELKKILEYGCQAFIDEILARDLNTILSLLLLSVFVSLFIALFITDTKWFAIIELDIIAINRKSKYKKLNKAQIQRIIINTKYFYKVKMKAEILRVIAGHNKYDFTEFNRLLKSSIQLYSFLKVKEDNKKQFLNYIDKLLHCCDKYVHLKMQ